MPLPVRTVRRVPRTPFDGVVLLSKALACGAALFAAALAGGAWNWGFALAEDAAAPAERAAQAAGEAPAQTPAAPADDAIDFNRQIRPILSNHCYQCHGPDEAERKGGFRLDIKASAFGETESGDRAIVPGNLEESAIAARITSSDASLVMPPPEINKPLSAEQIELLERWIASGANWQEHWSFVAPERSELPAVKQAEWPRNPIDRFTLARMEREGLAPAPEVEKWRLLRRVTLDLTGLPPTPEEVAAFLADEREDAYERVVDRLLASPRYGERMTVEWLDAARYADTHGFHIDSHRDMWRWREWVIDAFNDNMPYDRFIVEQVAGDMLPNATVDQKVASGFNRNHPINYEGGAIPEEYLNAYVVDRVNTTSTVFLGLTVACAQCHDHKYDPISQRDFYRLYAFFNNIAEQGLDGQRGNAAPAMVAPSREQREALALITLERDQAAAARDRRAAELQEAFLAWDQSIDREQHAAAPADDPLVHLTLDETEGDVVEEAAGRHPAGKIVGTVGRAAGKLKQAAVFDGATHVQFGDIAALAADKPFSFAAWIFPTTNDGMAILSKMDDANMFRGYDFYVSEGRIYVHIIHQWSANAIRVNTKTAVPLSQWHHVTATYDGSSKAAGVKIYVDGKLQELEITHDALNGTLETHVGFRIGSRTPGAGFRGMIDDVRVYARELDADSASRLAGVDAIAQLMALAPDKRSAEQTAQLREYYLKGHDEIYQKLVAQVEGAESRIRTQAAMHTSTMVMQERPEAPKAFMLMRGQYHARGEEVAPGVPDSLPPMPAGAPANRVGLAQWLAMPEHPLTARVAVNRFWQQYFGLGLVKTSEDFGSQGEWPSHPELLDWLAVEFVESGWNVKQLQRLIVTSATYRQSARVTPELRERDPENRLLARGPRHRMSAEMIRDHALYASGLMVEKVGGPSVNPYQPAGLWEEVAYGDGFTAQSFVQDHGEALYRRSMYTFWKRSCPPPGLQALDAPDREFCTSRRSITNTPLQPLVLMNDPTYVEAARAMAEKLMKEGGATPADKVQAAFLLAVSRPASAAETAAVLRVFERNLEEYKADPESAAKLLAVGESKRDESLDAAEHAAWTTVMNLILNLDETITKG